MQGDSGALRERPVPRDGLGALLQAGNKYMTNCKRQNYREAVKFDVVVHWEEQGRPCSGEFRARNLCAGGIRIEGTKRIQTGEQVRIDVPQYDFPLEAVVRYCGPAGTGASIGLKFCAETRRMMRECKAQRTKHDNQRLLGQISSGICNNATRLQHLDLERLRRWGALGEFREIVADLKSRTEQRTRSNVYDLLMTRIA
jgi:hypothetical protein